MKKYIIKNADGSWQHAMSAIHDTRKEAMLTLLRHITLVVEETNDDCIGDPFNYTIEEVDEKDVNERITDFESARRALGRPPDHEASAALRLPDAQLDTTRRHRPGHLRRQRHDTRRGGVVGTKGQDNGT